MENKIAASTAAMRFIALFCFSDEVQSDKARIFCPTSYRQFGNNIHIDTYDATDGDTR